MLQPSKRESGFHFFIPSVPCKLVQCSGPPNDLGKSNLYTHEFSVSGATHGVHTQNGGYRRQPPGFHVQSATEPDRVWGKSFSYHVVPRGWESRASCCRRWERPHPVSRKPP